MVEATNCRDQIVELRQHFERGNLQSMDYVDAVDLLRHVVSPDADDVLDEKLDSSDESEGGEGSEEPEEAAEVGRKCKGKGKAKVVPKKARVDHEEENEERDGSLRGVYETLSIPLFTDIVCSLRYMQALSSAVRRTAREDGMQRLPPVAWKMQSAAAIQDAAAANQGVPRRASAGRTGPGRCGSAST
jgi:hypothetical protein